MQYGMPKNFRAARPREDNRGGAKGFRGGHRKGKKKIGLAITHACGFFMKNVTHNKWYANAKGRDEAYKRLKNQRQWFYPEKFYYSSVKKIER